jgi:hypothetical protein
MHFVMTSVLSVTIGSLIVVMIVLNRPFLGPLGISPEPFEESLDLFNQIDGDFKQMESEEKAGAPSAAATPTEAPAAEPARETPPR